MTPERLAEIRAYIPVRHQADADALRVGNVTKYADHQKLFRMLVDLLEAFDQLNVVVDKWHARAEVMTDRILNTTLSKVAGVERERTRQEKIRADIAESDNEGLRAEVERLKNKSVENTFCHKHISYACGEDCADD